MWWINEKMLFWICFACMFKCLRVCVLRSYHTKRCMAQWSSSESRWAGDERKVWRDSMFETEIYRQPTYRQRHTLKSSCTAGTLWELDLLLNLLNAVCILQVNPCKIQLTYYSVQPIHIISHNATLVMTCHSQCDSQSWFLLTIIQLDCQQSLTGLNHRRKLSILQWHIKQNHFCN